MRDIQELSYQEIADRLQLPEGTVKSRINRGRTELARQIRKLQRRTTYRASGSARCAARTGAYWHEADDRTIAGDIAIVRVGEARLMYPLLAEFADRRHRPDRQRQRKTS